MTNPTAFTPAESVRLLEAAFNVSDTDLKKYGSPAYMLWGPPGVGKSSVVRQVCDFYKWHMVDIRLSTLAPTDIRGLPAIDRERMSSRWLRPDFFPTREDVLAMIDRGIEGIVVFLDEANTAPAQTQAAAYQLVLDRRVGEYEIPQVDFPEGHKKAGKRFPIHMLLAGNRSSDKGVTHQMPAPLLNRMGHIEMTASVQEFVDYGMRNAVDSRVLSFIGYNQSVDKLLRLPIPGERSFPTPRSWEVAARAIKGRPWDPTTRALVASHVGEGLATELGAYVEVFTELPDLDKVLNEGVIPARFQRDAQGNPPEMNIALKWSYVTTLTTRVIGQAMEGTLKDKVIDNWMLALGHMEAEFGQMGVIAPMRTKNIKIMQQFLKNAQYQAWNVANAKLLL